MYQLYINDQQVILKISKLHKVFENSFPPNLTDNEVYCYNIFYRFSKSRKALVRIACEIKEIWLKEAKDRIQQIEAIKI